MSNFKFLIFLSEFYNCVSSFLNTLAFKSRDFIDRAACFLRKFLSVDNIALFLENIEHIYSDNNRNTKFCKLSSKIKVSFEVSTVYDVKNSIRTLCYEVVSCNNFLKSIRRKGIDTRQVHNNNIFITFELTFLFFDCNTRPVTDILIRTG